MSIEILYIFVGICLGLIIGFFLGKRGSGPTQDTQALTNENSRLNGQLVAIEKQLQELKLELEKKDASLLQSVGEAQSFRAEKDLLIEKLKSQKDELAQMNSEMTLKFENLASRLLEEKSKKFTDLNSTQLKGLLDPLKEQIKDFEKKVDTTYGNERSERSELKGEIKKLMELNQKITTEAENLSRALKGDTKTQGAWGEILLESILEKSGLRKGEEYITQGAGMSMKDDDGRHQKPDIIVRLPDNKHIIVDSKMTLTAYEQYASAELPEVKERFAKEHVESLKKHITGLSAKKYHDNENTDSPDFTLLFMPLEPAFALAFRIEPTLFQTAWDKQIAIVSPTTLLTTLRTVAAIWKQDKMNKNALDIARQSGSLYEKFLGLLDDLSSVGQKIEQTQKSYDEVISKLSTGRGNLIRQVENLKDLGAKTEKSIQQTKIGQAIMLE